MANKLLKPKRGKVENLSKLAVEDGALVFAYDTKATASTVLVDIGDTRYDLAAGAAKKADNANALGGSSLQNIIDKIDSSTGDGTAFTGLDTTVNNKVKLTRANGTTVEKTINNVSNASTANYSKVSEKIGTSTIGSSTKPVYVSAGIPTAITSIPSTFVTAQQIADINLDTLFTPGMYWAGGSNSIVNKPTGVDAFGLEVVQSAAGWYTQICYASNNQKKQFIRYYNSSTSWSDWVEQNRLNTKTQSGYAPAPNAANKVYRTDKDGNPVWGTLNDSSIGKLASTVTFGNGGAAIIDQNSDTFRQRINIFDNASPNDAVFSFQQSTDAGKSYKDLFVIKDDGVVTASTFQGALKGTADYAKNSGALEGSSLKNIIDKINNSTGDGTAFTSLDTTTNDKVKLTRANGGTVEKVINNVSNASTANLAKNSNALGGSSLKNITDAINNNTASATSKCLPLSGGNMTGNIGYTGTKATYPMIKFIDNKVDTYGNGISIGGGGLTIIGGGESSDTISAQYSSGGDESMVIANDGAIDFYTNCQSGFTSAKHITMNADGSVTASSFNGIASTAKVTNLIADYNDTGRKISIGFAGSGLTANNLTHLAGYTNNGTQIKDVSKEVAGNWLGLDGYLKRYRLVNNITAGATDLNGTMPPAIFAYKNGYPLHTDPEFKSGNNDVRVYNNSQNGNVTIERIALDNGNSSGYVLKISNKGSASPGLGGWFFSDATAYGKQFTCIFRAKIPSGRNVQFASNSMGTNASQYWLTERAGTGKWEWYAYRVDCGSANFSLTNYFYIDGAAGTASAPVVWYLSYANTIVNSYGDYDGLRTRYADTASNSANSSSAIFSTYSAYPQGFNSRTNSATWGNTTGTFITGWHTSSGGDVAFMNDNPSNGKVSMKLDGYFYQNEGANRVLDTSDAANYVKKSGDTMTGTLTLKTGDQKGVKLGTAWLTAASDKNGEFVLQNGHLRFGASDWDYNKWAGLKYDADKKSIYLGLADGTIFTANAAQSGGSIFTPGIDNIYVGASTATKVLTSENIGDYASGKTAFTELDTATNNVIKLTRANGATVQKTINNVANATSANIASIANRLTMEAGTADVARNVWFSDNNARNKVVYNDNFKYNPVKNSLTTNITGKATSAGTADYAKGGESESNYQLNSDKLHGTIDLTGSTYNTNTWYPVVGSSIPERGYSRIICYVQLNSRTKPAWSTHNSGFTCNLDVLAKAGGWGTTNAGTIVLDYSWSFTQNNISPISYQQLTNASRPVIWMRGGGKYFIRSSEKFTWEVKTSSFTLSSQTIAPQTSCPGLSFSRSTIYANVNGSVAKADSATNASTADYAKNAAKLGGLSADQYVTKSDSSGSLNADVANRLQSFTSVGNVTNSLFYRYGKLDSSWSNFPASSLPSTGIGANFQGKNTGILHIAAGSSYHDLAFTAGAKDNQGILYAGTGRNPAYILDTENYKTKGNVFNSLTANTSFTAKVNVTIDGGSY